MAESIGEGNNLYAIPENDFKILNQGINFYRFYKWPLTSNIVIPSLNLKEFIDSDLTHFKFVKVGKLKDVSSLRAHGVGAVHGEKDIYEFVPVDKKPKKRSVGKIDGHEHYYGSKSDYRNLGLRFLELR